jgi:hypothetical protein
VVVFRVYRVYRVYVIKNDIRNKLNEYKNMIYVNASQLATAIGLNVYDSDDSPSGRKALIARAWAVQFPDQAIRAKKRMPNIILSAPALDAIVGCHTVRNLHAAAVECEDLGHRDAIIAEYKETVRQRCSEHIGANSSSCSPAEVDLAQTTLDIAVKLVSSSVNTERGCRDEVKAIDVVQRQTGRNVYDGNKNMYYTTVETLPVGVRIGGRVDGLQGDGVFVEVKNRQRRLKRRVWPNEMSQIQAYLHMPGLVLCRFCERLANDSWSADIARDDVFWNEVVVKGLQRFVDDVFTLQNDEGAQADVARFILSA